MDKTSLLVLASYVSVFALGYAARASISWRRHVKYRELKV